jgi:hypothetical protein
MPSSPSRLPVHDQPPRRHVATKQIGQKHRTDRATNMHLDILYRVRSTRQDFSSSRSLRTTRTPRPCHISDYIVLISQLALRSSGRGLDRVLLQFDAPHGAAPAALDYRQRQERSERHAQHAKPEHARTRPPRLRSHIILEYSVPGSRLNFTKCKLCSGLG